MTDLGILFAEEEGIQKSVKEISQGILDMSDFVLSKSPIELAEAEVVGKRVRNACDKINDQVHLARNTLGKLMTHASKVNFKGSSRSLSEMENELSLIHGDLEVIGSIAERFFEAKDRKIAFENLNQHYSELVEHVTSLMVSESNLK